MRGNGVDRKIVKLMRQGHCNKDISKEVNLCLSGVKYHITQIYKALGLYGTGAWKKFYIIGERETLRRLLSARNSRVVGQRRTL